MERNDTPEANARFWIFWNDEPTKITLRPGQEIGIRRGGRTEDGWHSETMILEHTGDGVRREWYQEELDCDGRLDRYGELYCPLEELRAIYNSESGVFYPAWQSIQRGQRDYQAERAGY